MDEKVKNVFIKSALIGLISFVILSNIVPAVKRFFKIKENKIMIILSKLLAEPLYKKQKEIINEIIDLSMMIDKIYEINISSDHWNYKKSKSYNDSKSQNFSYKILYKNKNAGLLNIVFRK